MKAFLVDLLFIALIWLVIWSAIHLSPVFPSN